MSPTPVMGNAAPAVEERPAEGTEGMVPVVPFIRASDESIQPAGIDVTSAALSAATQDLGFRDITAYGYMRFLYILVQATGGAGAAAVAAEDAPFSVLRDIALTEPNGATIVSFNTGHQMFLANKYGGYNHPVAADPRRSPNFSAVAATGNFSFLLKVPVFLSGRDGVGALPNQDSSGKFKFRATIGNLSHVYTTNPTTIPVVRVRAWLASYDQPAASSAGLMNEVQPPGLGTTSFWSTIPGINVSAGDTSVEITRKGNYIRQLIFVLRGVATPTRANGEAQWAPETRYLRDEFPSRYLQNEIWKETMYERLGLTGTAEAAGGPDNGVRFIDYMHEFDGGLGRENRDLWQPSRGSTSLKIAGTFGLATTMDILVNDVAIGENVFL